jgi:pyroglutamyl-peptidase
MYGLLHKIGALTEVRGGFIHIPYLPEQAAAHAGAPSMAAQTVKRGLEVAIAVAIRQQADIKITGGATH